MICRRVGSTHFLVEDFGRPFQLTLITHELVDQTYIFIEKSLLLTAASRNGQPAPSDAGSKCFSGKSDERTAHP